MRSRHVPRELAAAGVLALAGVTAFVAGTFAQQRTEPIEVTVTGVDDAANLATLKLINRSGRAIVAWQVTLLSDSEVLAALSEDLFDSDRRLAVDGETTIRMPRAAGVSSLKVSAVFEDQSASGDEEGIARIFALRTERREALQAWITDLKAELVRGVGVGELRNTFQERDEAKNIPATLGLNHDAVAILNGPGTPAQVQQKLQQLLQRAERKLGLAQTAAVRKGAEK